MASKTRKLWVMLDDNLNMQCVLKAPIHATKEEVEAFYLGSDTNAIPCTAIEANVEVMHTLNALEMRVLHLWNGSLVVPDIATMSGLTIEEVSRILDTLVLMRFIVKNPDGRMW